MKTEFVRAAMHSAAGQGLAFPSPEFEQHVAGYLGRIEGTAPDRTADALERIAAALERLSPIGNPAFTLPPPGHYNPHYISPISPTYPFTNPTTWRSPSTACAIPLTGFGPVEPYVDYVSLGQESQAPQAPEPVLDRDAVAEER